MSYTFEITTAGKVLIAKAQTGTTIEFTKAELGKGDLIGSPTDFTSLLDHVPTNVIIQQKEFVEGAEEAKITLTYTNESLLEGFYVREIGLYVNDPDEGEILFLYCHSDEADYLPVSSYASVEQVVNLIIKVDNASYVTAQILPETSVIRDNFAANSILKADLDNEPEALIVGEDCVLGRKAGGKIESLSVSEMRKLLSISDYGCRHAVQSWGNGVDLDEVKVKGNEVLSEQGNGATRSVNFGLDFTNKHGMALFKDITNSRPWRLGSTLLGTEKVLYTDDTYALTEELDSIIGFTSNGINLGSSVGVNDLGDAYAEFAFHCPLEKVRKFENVKSVIFDFADNWAGNLAIGIRSIEFEDPTGNIISLEAGTDYEAYATTYYGVEFLPEYTFDTTLLKVGSNALTQWQSASGAHTNQRLIIVFNTVQTFVRFIINNHHSSGTNITYGAKNTKIHTSTDSITDTTYDASISNSELIFDGQIAQHKASNVEDDKYYCRVHWAYNPATGFFMLLHDGDNGSADFPIRNWMGKRQIFSSIKSLDQATPHYVYNIMSGIQFQLVLNETTASAFNTAIFHEMSENSIVFGPTANINSAGYRYFTWGFVGEDLGHITPGMWGIEGAVSIHTLTDGGTYDCGIDESKVKAVILKRTSNTSNWGVFNSSSGWDTALALNKTDIEVPSGITFSGSKITLTTWTGTWIVLVIGEDGKMPEGSTINIRADEKKPAIFTIADGFDKYGPKDHPIIETADKVITTPAADGLYEVCVDEEGNYSFEEEKPHFDNTPGVMRGSENKLPIMTANIFDSKVVDIDLIPVDDRYETEWFPVEVDTLYEFDNKFNDTKIDVDIWWSSDASDENKRFVQYHFYQNTNSIEYSFGAVKRINSDHIYIGTGNIYTYFSSYSGDSLGASNDGYYKLVVRREW